MRTCARRYVGCRAWRKRWEGGKVYLRSVCCILDVKCSVEVGDRDESNEAVKQLHKQQGQAIGTRAALSIFSFWSSSPSLLLPLFHTLTPSNMSQPLKLLGLAEQPKLKARARPSRPSAVLKLPSEPYITHLTLLQQGNGSGAPLLVAASSDGALRAHDALTLAPLAQAAWAHSTLGDISAVTPAKHAGATALVAGKNGVVALWDPRFNNEQPALTLKGPSRAPYISLASAADGYSVAVGTELKGYEAMVDLW